MLYQWVGLGRCTPWGHANDFGCSSQLDVVLILEGVLEVTSVTDGRWDVLALPYLKCDT